MKNTMLQILKGQLRQHSSPDCGRIVGTGIPALNDLLPGGGLRPGLLLELLADGRGSGAAMLAVRIAVQCQQQPGEVLFVDRSQRFYAPAAARQGLDLRRLIVVHPGSEAEALWVLEQSLRCSGLNAVIAGVGNIGSVAFRRLQLAAEHGRTIGLLLRPAGCRGQPSWADVRLTVRPQASAANGPEITRRIDVELHCRGRLSDARLMLELDDETGDVREVSQLAGAAAACRTA